MSIIDTVEEAVRVDTETASLAHIVCEAPNGEEFRILKKYFSEQEGVEGFQKLDSGEEVAYKIPKGSTDFEYIRMQ